MLRSLCFRFTRESKPCSKQHMSCDYHVSADRKTKCDNSKGIASSSKIQQLKTFDICNRHQLVRNKSNRRLQTKNSTTSREQIPAWMQCSSWAPLLTRPAATMRIQLFAAALATVAMVAGSTNAGPPEGTKTCLSCLSSLKACASSLSAYYTKPGDAAAISACEAAVDRCADACIDARISCDAWASNILEGGASKTR